MTMQERRELAHQIKPIADLTNELGVHGGAYNPAKYEHYLPKKQMEIEL